jgi:4-amino-4-deoxy-L-arabinose transferase-like glycosyltransferase
VLTDRLTDRVGGRWWLSGLAVLTLARLWLAAVMPLAPDEAYYWIWSRALAPGYLDHPPMVAIWIRAGTGLLGATPLGVRLLGPLSAALGSLLLADAANRLFPGRSAGVTAAVLLNGTLLFTAGSIIMTPDTPLLFFWTLTLWAAARLASGGGDRWWLLAGAASGLAMVSKYTGAFLPIGLGLYLLRVSPRALRRPWPWIGVLIAAILFLPVLFWNADHHWVGLLRQGGRVGDWRPERALRFLGELFLGQIGLATPGIFVLGCAGGVTAVRGAWKTADPAWTLLAALSLPPAIVFLQHALGDRVQGNWPAILYPAAMAAAAGLSTPAWRRMIGPSAAFGFVLSALVCLHAGTGLPRGFTTVGPVALQMGGWDGLARDLERARTNAGAVGVAAEPYGLAAELAWSGTAATPVMGPGTRWALLPLPRMAPDETPILLMRPARYGEHPDPALWRDVEPAGEIARRSGDDVIERYALFRARPAGPDFPGARLPRRGE